MRVNLQQRLGTCLPRVNQTKVTMVGMCRLAPSAALGSSNS